MTDLLEMSQLIIVDRWANIIRIFDQFTLSCTSGLTAKVSGCPRLKAQQRSPVNPLHCRVSWIMPPTAPLNSTPRCTPIAFRYCPHYHLLSALQHHH
ncbi:MAG: hypothetical protein HC899_13905 [Leptolyngbyaceae cyanobacterium SM1_4_3]|nr:hypothetical protein [Leptolyngbyaceae cyanobacterium SM1_4_3]